MKYLWHGDRIGFACQLCEPPSEEDCIGCKCRTNAKYPARKIRINNTTYVVADSEVTE